MSERLCVPYCLHPAPPPPTHTQMQLRQAGAAPHTLLLSFSPDSAPLQALTQMQLHQAGAEANSGWERHQLVLLQIENLHKDEHTSAYWFLTPCLTIMSMAMANLQLAKHSQQLL